MDRTIRYLNTDLDLTSSAELTTLAAAFEARGVHALHVDRQADGLWYARFESDAEHDAPEPTIAALIAVVESLAESMRAVWAGCARREFNIGYDCGDEPWAFDNGLSPALLGRIAAAGASLRITLYPPASAPVR